MSDLVGLSYGYKATNKATRPTEDLDGFMDYGPDGGMARSCVQGSEHLVQPEKGEKMWKVEGFGVEMEGIKRDGSEA